MIPTFISFKFDSEFYEIVYDENTNEFGLKNINSEGKDDDSDDLVDFINEEVNK